MKFKMVMTHHHRGPPDIFDENTAPKWLCEGGYTGSTMDNRWFWDGYVLKLEVGKSIKTDFRTITRIE